MFGFMDRVFGVALLALAVGILATTVNAKDPSVRSATQSKSSFGFIKGDVVTKWLQNDPRIMEVQRDLLFVDSHKTKWSVPKGAKINGASIPRELQSIVGTPYVGYYRRASVFHDFYCDAKLKKWRQVHAMFYDAMRADGVSKLKAQVMWAAVRYFGPRWRGFQRDGKCIDSCDEVVPKEPKINTKWFRNYVDWLEEDKWKLNFSTLNMLADICDKPNSKIILRTVGRSRGLDQWMRFLQRQYPKATNDPNWIRAAWDHGDFGCPEQRKR